MSRNDALDLSSKTWLPFHRNLIVLVKKYPNIYDPSLNKRQTTWEKTKWNTAWIEIATQLCQPGSTCKQLWNKIKLSYAKIMILIKTGKISKKAAFSHPETRKYFDGLLSFMDPFICTISERHIPFAIHKSINDIFGLTNTKQIENGSSENSCTRFVTHAKVKALLRERQNKEEQNLSITVAEYLQRIVDNAVKLKLEELLLVQEHDLSDPSQNLISGCKGMPNFSLVPNKNIDEENTITTVNLGLETEFIIEDDIKWESEDDDSKMDGQEEENVTLEKNTNNSADEIGKNDSAKILPSMQIIMPAVHEVMKSLNNDAISSEVKTDNIAVMESNESPMSDEYMRKFCNELGIVMSLELSINEQKSLKSRINELLIEILLKEDDHIEHTNKKKKNKKKFTSIYEDQ